MIDDFFPIDLTLGTREEPVPCPNCNAKLDRKTVMSESSANLGRPYVTCAGCAEDGKICFWFLDYGECDVCECPMFRSKAKKGPHVGRPFSACSQGCPGKFKWLDGQVALARKQSFS
jgi:hypothetical protein